MKKHILFILIMLTLSTHSFGRVRESNSEDNAPITNNLQLLSLNPTSIDEMIRSSSLVIQGTVLEVNEVVDPDAETMVARKTNTRNSFVATVKINDIYKGGYPEDEINVEFKRSEKIESTPLINMYEGDELILFLVPGEKPPHFTPVSLTNGAIPSNEDNSRKVIEITEGPEKDPGKVTINISVSKDESSIFATVMIMNNTKKPIRIDSTLSPSKIFTLTTAEGEQKFPIGNPTAASPEYVLTLPQHFIGARYDLSEYYELPAGKYYIRANFMNSGWSPDKNPEIITSKIVSFEVSD